MTDRTKRTLKGSIFALMMTAAIGYGIASWPFSSPSMAQPTISATLDNLQLHNRDVIEAFYQGRGMRTIWLRGSTKFQPRARATLEILQNSWTHGLNPENYHVPRLIELAAHEKMNRQEFDMLLSDGVVRYARDLTGMRGSHSPNDRAGKYWRQPMAAQDVIDKIVEAGDPVRELYNLEPNGKLYQALRGELIALSRQRGSDKIVRLPAGFKPGRTHEQVAALREKLGGAAPAANPQFYDDELAARVMALQRRNGQQADGVLRAGTLAAINQPVEGRMMQIIANMERLRWMEQGRPERYVLVNIPSASLWAVDDGKVVLEMPVIVGKTARPTYSFKTEITGVRFNPNWTVPPTIKNKDFLPMLQQNPAALAERGIRITYKGRLIDPTKVDWATVTPRDLSQVKMIQNPGDDNPLGKVRVIMENPYNIYLHDTNHREMFDQDERNLSSGCIRVQQPEKLAGFILKNNDGWSEAGMNKMISSGRMRDVKSEHTTPVYITYQTIWLDSEGKLIYGRDVYGQDAALGEILKKAKGIHIPSGSENKEISL